MAQRENKSIARKERATLKQQLANEAARVQEYVRLAMPRRSEAEKVIMRNYGYFLEAILQDRTRTIMFFPCMYPGNEKMSVDFFACVVCNDDWTDDVEFKIVKGLPL